MNKKVFLFLSFLFFSLVTADSFYYFIPPKGWNLVDPSKLSKRTQIAFVSKSNKPFKASLNLGTEKISISLEDYVKAAKKHLCADRNNKWSELGYIKTKAGKAHIAQIDSKNGCGDIRSMQCILVDNSTAYVLTAVTLKEEFLDYYNEFIEAFESFSIYPSALDSLNSLSLKAIYLKKTEKLKTSWQELSKKTSLDLLFEDKNFQKKHWKDFEKFLEKSFPDQGLFWQAMAAKEMKASLTTSAAN